MDIKCISVAPNLKSINRELIFTISVSEIEVDKIPIKIQGELFSEDKFKIGDLKDISSSNTSNLWLNAKDTPDQKKNNSFNIVLSCELNERTINHIENYRVNKKEMTKDIVFYVQLNTQFLESNVILAHFHLTGGSNEDDAHNTYYQYKRNFRPDRTNLWLLSGNGGPNFLNQRKYAINDIEIKIDLMEWINTYISYLNIGNVIIYEFLQPDEIILSKELSERYDRAQVSLKEVKKQIAYGEWKTAIIKLRPVFELFKNFDEFKNILINSGYSQAAYDELKKTIHGLFSLVSKFHHGLDGSNLKVNPDMPVQKEDAYLAYSFSVSLLYLISQKIRRVN